MKTYLLKPGVRQAIAKAGETDIAVAYNAKEWLDDYPAGVPQLMVTRPDGVRVPVTVTVTDNMIAGQVPNELLVNPGLYSYVFVWTSGSTQLESGRCECMVLGSELAKTWADVRRAPDWAERIFLAAGVIEGAFNGAMEARNTAVDMAEEAEAHRNAAEDAQEAAEEAAEAAQDVLESIPQDYTALSNDVGDLKNALYNDESAYSNWVQGTHSGSTGEFVPSTTRCTLSRVFVLHTWDEITVRDIDNGLYAAIAAAKNGVNVFDSTWKTSDYTYTVPAAADGATFIVNVKNEQDELAPSDITSLNVAIKNSRKPYTTIGRLTASSDIDTIIEIGTYRVSADSTSTWKPDNWPASGGGILLVIKGYGVSDTFGVCQMILLSDRVLIRYGTSGTSWTEWNAYYSEGSSPIVSSLSSAISTINSNTYQKKAQLTNTDDIDTVLDFGFYRAFGNSLPAHWPTTGGGNMLVMFASNSGTDSFGRCQVVWAANKMLVRFGISGTTWTDWNYYRNTSNGIADIVAFNDEEETTAKLRQLSTCYTIDNVRPVQPLTILHFSDLHQNVTALKNVIAFADHYSTYIDDCIHTGDGINNSTETNVFGTVDGAGTILNMIGNHETWDTDDWYAMTESDSYTKYISPFVSNWDVTITTGKCYYYKDYDEKHVRLIALDCMHETTDQLDWFITALAGAKTKGYHVLIADHVIMGKLEDMTYLDSGFDNPVYPRTSTPSYPFPMYADDGYTDAVDEFVSGGGIVAAWIAGHMHSDTLATYHNILNIAVTTAGTYTAVGVTTDARADGTRSADAFNVMGIDTVRGYLYMMRVGMNYNAAMKKIDTLCWDYINHRMVYTC